MNRKPPIEHSKTAIVDGTIVSLNHGLEDLPTLICLYSYMSIHILMTAVLLLTNWEYR